MQLEESNAKLKEFIVELNKEIPEMEKLKNSSLLKEVETREKVLKQKLASKSYDVAKFTKDFIALVEEEEEVLVNEAP